MKGFAEEPPWEPAADVSPSKWSICRSLLLKMAINVCTWSGLRLKWCALSKKNSRGNRQCLLGSNSLSMSLCAEIFFVQRWEGVRRPCYLDATACVTVHMQTSFLWQPPHGCSHIYRQSGRSLDSSVGEKGLGWKTALSLEFCRKWGINMIKGIFQQGVVF